VQRAVSALEIKPGGGAVPAGTPVQLALYAISGKGSTTLIPGNMTIWSSSKDSVAEINRQGRLNPRRPGTVTITARYGDKTVQATFTIVGS
jgi:hypothetical protein